MGELRITGRSAMSVPTATRNSRISHHCCIYGSANQAPIDVSPLETRAQEFIEWLN
jgi:hypothetical protein